MKKIHSTFIAVFTGFAAWVSVATSLQAYCVIELPWNPGGTWSSGASVLAVATQSDGKALVGGYFTYYGNYPNGYPFTVNNLVRFNVDGTVDTSFLASPNGIVRAILVQPDGKILIGGHFTQVYGFTQTYISRLTPANGYPDYIGFQAPVPNNYVYALGRLSDGRVIVGGAFTTMAGFSYSRVACLKTSGGLVATFNPGVSGGANAAVWSIAVYPAGTPSADKVMLGGEFNWVGGYARTNVARLTSTGPTDSTFDTGVAGAGPLNGPVYAVATDYGPFSINGIDMLEKVLIGGSFTGLGGGRSYFARLANEGYPDYNVINSFVDGTVKSIRVQSDHRVVLGGYFAHAQSYVRNGVVRLIPNLDLMTWDFDWAECTPNAAGGGSVEAVGLSSAGSIYVGGSFTTFEGYARPKIARLFSAP